MRDDYSCQPIEHQVRLAQLGQRIQCPECLPGIHTVPVSQRSPSSLMLIRDLASHESQVTTTVPDWRAPVE